MMIAARDNEMLKALIANQNKQASDPFVKVTRRILFFINHIYYVFFNDFLCYEPTYIL